jgi:hypothetical protein
MFPDDGRRVRRRIAARRVSALAATPAPPICSTSRDSSIISRGDPRGPPSIRTANGPSAPRGISVWDGFPAIPFRGADPTRLRIYFGEQQLRDVLMPATDRSPRHPGCSTNAMPRVFRNQFLSLVTLSFVPSPRQLTKRTDHFRYMIHREKRVQNRRTSCSEYSDAAPRPSQSRTRGPERAARFTVSLKLDYGVPVPLTRGDTKAPTAPPCCERGGNCCVKMSTLQPKCICGTFYSVSLSV